MNNIDRRRLPIIFSHKERAKRLIIQIKFLQTILKDLKERISMYEQMIEYGKEIGAPTESAVESKNILENSAITYKEHIDYYIK